MAGSSDGATPGASSGVPGRLHRAPTWPEVVFASAWLIPAVLGAVLGAVGWLVSGWPWWPLIGAGVLWSAAFLLPLYWPGFRPARWSLRTELLLVLRPSRGMERLRAEEEGRFRRAAFPLYGLPASFPGERYLVASGTGGSWRRGYVVRWLSLGHGAPRRQPGSEWLIVETADRRSAPAETVRRRQLAERMWIVEQLEAYYKGGQPPESGALIADRPDPAWSAMHIDIDGAPVLFEYAADGGSWAARAAHGDYVISLLASWMPVEAVALVAVTDLEPYIDGSRRLHATAACAVPPPQPAG